ncbi:helix-turn-helix domain-containing protein [Kitasatospora sp. NPDC088134]|uniref:helix-turn-helix domain-containing protein n=1 Tax=Kitasatospora sp. NPDC088134 TaxID=3364071 RepID=UPI003829FAEA
MDISIDVVGSGLQGVGLYTAPVKQRTPPGLAEEFKLTGPWRGPRLLYRPVACGGECFDFWHFDVVDCSLAATIPHVGVHNGAVKVGVSGEVDGGSSAESLALYWGRLLKQFREQADLSAAELGRLINYSPAAMSHFENAHRIMPMETARACDDLLKTGGQLAGLLPYVLSVDLPPEFKDYVRHERRATQILAFEPQVVSGLFQTEAYAEAVLRAARLDNLQQALANRMNRQEILRGDDPPYLWVIMEEHILDKLVGGREVMRAQIERLLEEAENPRVVIQFIPKTVGAHAGLDGPLTILSFAEGPDIVYCDGHASGRLILPARAVAACSRAYDLLRSTAVSPDQSIAMLKAKLEELTP